MQAGRQVSVPPNEVRPPPMGPHVVCAQQRRGGEQEGRAGAVVVLREVCLGDARACVNVTTTTTTTTTTTGVSTARTVSRAQPPSPIHIHIHVLITSLTYRDTTAAAMVLSAVLTVI